MNEGVAGAIDRWTNAAGETFRRICWSSPADSDTLIVFVHGLGGHAGRYDRYVSHLLPLNAHIWGYDQRGHGESDGKRGDAEGLAHLAADLVEVTDALRSETGATRVVFIGHSMGAAVVSWQLTQGSVPEGMVAAVMSAPPLKVSKTAMMRVKIGAGRILNKVVPSLLMSNELDPRHISSVPEEVQRYLDDPLVHDRLSVRLGLSIIRGGELILASAGRVEVPLLLVQGVEDGIASVAGTREFHAAVGSVDKRIIELPGLRHETHHEAPDRVRVYLADVRQWIAERIGDG